MRVISWSRLREFGAAHVEVETRLQAWYHVMKVTTYQSPHDLQRDFPNVSLLGEGLAVFNIGSCRLEAHMRYDLGRVYIRSIDTHEDYDRRNKKRKQ